MSDYVPHPLGARLLVKILSNEFVTKGGIIVPEFKGEATAPDMVKSGPPTLQLIEILDVGEGRYDAANGKYLGSRFKKGDKALLRCGPTSQIHIDILPGRHNELIVLEDTLVCLVEMAKAPTPVPVLAGTP